MIDKYLAHLSPSSFHILLALRGGPLHGYGIIKAVEVDTSGKITLLTGSLYNSLKRLLSEGLISEVDGDSRRRNYKLSELGRELVISEIERYQQVVELKKLEGGINV